MTEWRATEKGLAIVGHLEPASQRLCGGMIEKGIDYNSAACGRQTAAERLARDMR